MKSGAGERTQIKREVQELSLLLEISRILDQSLDLRDVLGPVLEAIARHMGMSRATIALLNRDTQHIAIEAAYGLSPSQRERGRYAMGEGVTGAVVATGTPRVVPRISEEPGFLDRTRSRGGKTRDDLSFVCVPIKIGNETMGTLSTDRPWSDGHSLDDDLRLLTIVGSMIAQAVRLSQSAQEEQRRLLEENERLRESLRARFRPANIIGNSKAMQGVYDLVAQVSSSDATVLLLGESGVGKELVAHAIHYNSRRADNALVKVNCAALPQGVLESELFGHERGAFTGAVQQRKGRFELAHSGTIFLDEVGDLSPATQISLLRILQEREFERVGGTETVKTDVRVIAATNRNLTAMVTEGRFREDLYYRLNVFPIRVPPLRERRSDILLLADHFVQGYSSANGKHIKRISTSAIDMLLAYHWPGNVRELENCIERAVLLANDDVILGHHLPPTLQTAEASGTVHAGTLQESLDKLERELILDGLKTSRGNMAKAAEALGLTERVMGLRVRKHGIDARRFRMSRRDVRLRAEDGESSERQEAPTQVSSLPPRR